MARQLPIVNYLRKYYFLDIKLGVLRNIEDYSDCIDLGHVNMDELEGA